MSDPSGKAAVFGERRPAIAIAALAFLLLNMTLASAMVVAVYDFDLALFTSNGGVIERGPAVAGLLRVATLIDMVGYLALAPVVLYMHGRIRAAVPERLRRLGLPSTLTFAALGFVIVGAIGAVTLASVGPWLLDASVAGPDAQAVARLQFGALEKFVFVGLWGTLALLMLGTWLVGVNWVLRAEGRPFAWLGAVAGLGALGYAVRSGLTGQTPLPIAGPVDILIVAALGCLPLWALWLSIRLWRGR